MVTTQMKTDAQRLGNGRKAFNVKQVEKMLEEAGGGTEYTAGTGITIAEDVISADTSVLATKSELPDMTLYQEKLTAGTGITIIDNLISSNISLKKAQSFTDVMDFENNIYSKDCIVKLNIILYSTNYNVTFVAKKGEALSKTYSFGFGEITSFAGSTHTNGLRIYRANSGNFSQVLGYTYYRYTDELYLDENNNLKYSQSGAGEGMYCTISNNKAEIYYFD